MKANLKPKRNIPDEGVHLAWLYSVIDIGTQKTEFKGEVKHNRKIRFTWEICSSRVSEEDPRPLSISSEYTWSFAEKAKLRKLVKSWLGKEPGDDFDLEGLLEHPCQISIIHKKTEDNTYANVDNVMAVPKGMKVPKRENGITVFQIELGDQEVYDAFPDFIKNKITASPEGAARFAGTSPAPEKGKHQPDPDEDIPF